MCDIALTVESPVHVRYDTDTQTVTFQTPTRSGLCLHVRLLSADSSSWTSQLHCRTEQTEPVRLRDDVGSIEAVEVSFCLHSRPDVCGHALNATIGQYSQIISLVFRQSTHAALVVDKKLSYC